MMGTVTTPAGEPRWPASIVVLAALALQFTLPQRLTLGPTWVLPTIELALVVPLTIANPYRDTSETRALRWLSVGLIALANAANLYSLVLIVHYLLQGGHASGRLLIGSAIVTWLTLVLVFGLWFWEFDQGGPAGRASGRRRPPDLLFPQQASPEIAAPNWSPGVIDYLYVALTNATAFSPTDTMPLAQWAKVLFGVQALASLLTVALVAARAVNILT